MVTVRKTMKTMIYRKVKMIWKKVKVNKRFLSDCVSHGSVYKESTVHERHTVILLQKKRMMTRKVKWKVK